MDKTGPKPINMSKYNTSIGLSGEALVRYLLHMWKYDVYAPDNPSKTVDFAIKNGDEWATIQVKTTVSRKGVHLKRGCVRNGKLSAFKYDEQDFDYLFAVRFPKVFVIPFMSIETISYIGFKDYTQFSYDLNDPETYSNPPKLL